jgi:hypothetical protein
VGLFEKLQLMYMNEKTNNTNIVVTKTKILVLDDHPIVRDGVAIVSGLG